MIGIAPSEGLQQTVTTRSPLGKAARGLAMLLAAFVLIGVGYCVYTIGSIIWREHQVQAAISAQPPGLWGQDIWGRALGVGIPFAAADAVSMTQATESLNDLLGEKGVDLCERFALPSETEYRVWCVPVTLINKGEERHLRSDCIQVVTAGPLEPQAPLVTLDAQTVLDLTQEEPFAHRELLEAAAGPLPARSQTRWLACFLAPTSMPVSHKAIVRAGCAPEPYGFPLVLKE